MDGLLELLGAWFSRIYGAYAIGILAVPAFLFLHAIVLVFVAWGVDRLRGWLRIVVELIYGLLNPVFYLAVLTLAMPELVREPQAWPAWAIPLLLKIAWILLAAFWLIRFLGAAVGGSRSMQVGIRALMAAMLAVLAIFALKDGTTLIAGAWGNWETLLNTIPRAAPLYLIPGVLLWDHLRSTFEPSVARRRRLFLLDGRPARLAVAATVALAALTIASAMARRSDGSVRALVAGHRAGIQAAARHYDVDPRLVAAIVYVTHKDQLSPFRDSLERVVMGAWALNPFGQSEDPMLNRPLDISVGLAQIKPRTAQTATLLASGRQDDLPIYMGTYRGAEPHGGGWRGAQPLDPPIPVPSERNAVASALLDDRVNLEMCALILALYQRQWEGADPSWSLRARPDILATLYQIGFAKSKPHAAPRSNAFGERVRTVAEQDWIRSLFL